MPRPAIYTSKHVLRFTKRQDDFIKSLYEPEKETFTGTVRGLIDFCEFLLSTPLWKILKPLDVVRAELLDDFEQDNNK